MANSNLQLQLGAEVTFFKTDLVGMVDSESGRIIVRQPNSGAKAPGLTIDEFIGEIEDVFTNLGIDVPKIELPDAISNVTKGVSLSLKEIYLMIDTVNGSGSKAKGLDFAIWVSMEISDALKAMFPVTINKGYLKLWNTENPVILDELQISSTQKMIGALDMSDSKTVIPDKSTHTEPTEN